MDPLNASFISPTSTMILSEAKQLLPINYPYLLSEIFVALFAILGNSLTLFVFVMDRKLRRLTNYYIASLALADLLVGVLGVPFAILTSLGLPRSLWACLIMLSFLVVLCTISIFCLVAVSIDRYWAILYPLVYSRIMTGKLARRIIVLCWCLGAIVGLLPVFGWHNEEKGICLFTHIMDYDFLVFLYFFTIVGPGVLMSFFYAHIYSVVLKQLRHIASQEKTHPEAESTFGPDSSSYFVGTVPRPSVGSPFNTKNIRRSLKGIACISSTKNDDKKSDSSDISTIGITQSNSCLSKINPATNTGFQSPHTSRRSSGSPLFNSQFAKASGKEIKAAKNLSIIVVFFFFCWFPLYTINCIQAFCSECQVPLELINFTIILSHANSAINPLLYAYHMKDFRRSLEFYVLRKLGLKRFKNNHRGSPLSPHYSTVLNVNMGTSTSIGGETTLLTPYLENSTALPFRLFHANKQSSTSVSQNSPRIVKKEPSLDKLYFISLDGGRKRPSNSTFSWPPTLLSRSLISHPSLLDSCSSVSEIRKFQSVEGITGVWTPFWEIETTPPPNGVSPNANLEVSFLYYSSVNNPPDKENNHQEHDSLLHKSFSAPPSPSNKSFSVIGANHFIKSTSSVEYHRLSSQCSHFDFSRVAEHFNDENKIFHGCIFKSKSEKQLCK